MLSSGFYGVLEKVFLGLLNKKFRRMDKIIFVKIVTNKQFISHCLFVVTRS